MRQPDTTSATKVPHQRFHHTQVGFLFVARQRWRLGGNSRSHSVLLTRRNRSDSLVQNLPRQTTPGLLPAAVALLRPFAATYLSLTQLLRVAPLCQFAAQRFACLSLAQLLTVALTPQLDLGLPHQTQSIYICRSTSNKTSRSLLLH